MYLYTMYMFLMNGVCFAIAWYYEFNYFCIPLFLSTVVSVTIFAEEKYAVF